MPIHHVAIDVTDLDSVVPFYEDHLGLEFVDELEIEGVRNVWYGSDGSADVQFRVVDGPVDPQGVHHLAFEVADVDSVVADVDPDRVNSEPETIDRFGLRVAFVVDPAGYTLELVQPVE